MITNIYEIRYANSWIMSDYLVKCKSCGHGVTSSDDIKAAQELAHQMSCQKCNSREFTIVERSREVEMPSDE